MTELLLRLFVKNRRDTSSPAVRTVIGQLAGSVGIGCNLLLFAGKLLAGILSGSVAITADALNNMTDAVSSIVTLAGFQLAKRPADQDHPYGHGRYEYLSGLAVSMLILFIGFELLKSSVSKIFQPTDSQYSVLAVMILLVCMGVKLWMSLFFRQLSKKISSAALQATSIDSRNDVIATGAVLVGCLTEYWFHVQVDGYVGATVSLFILYSGIKSAKQTISPLLGSQADETLIRQLSEVITSHDKILGIHDLLIHDYGPGQRYASVHAELSAQYDPMVCHEIIDHIENEVMNTLSIQLVIHFDPVPVDDNERVQLQQAITKTVQQIDRRFSVHDLRIDRKAHAIYFDLAIPFGLQLEQELLRQQIRKGLDAKWHRYDLLLQIDRT